MLNDVVGLRVQGEGGRVCRRFCTVRRREGKIAQSTLTASSNLSPCPDNVGFVDLFG